MRLDIRAMRFLGGICRGEVRKTSLEATLILSLGTKRRVFRIIMSVY